MNAMVDTLKSLSPAKLGAMVGVTLALIAFFIFITVRVSQPSFAPLYSNLPTEDASGIVTQLESMDVPYRLEANGTMISVPSDRVLRLRMNMAEKGLPSGGSMVGYEIFDRSEALGTSNFVQNVNMLRALEGELARTIGSLGNVESARVHLVMPKRELFTRQQQEPSGSVMLKLRGAGEIGKGEIAAIQHLVAAAVPGLKTSRITIVDGKGNLLARGVDDENDPSVLASSAEERRVAYENRIAGIVEQMVEQTVGAGKVKANVHAEMDFDRIVTNSETYDPEGQVARSVQTNEEQEQSTERDQKDTVSVANNLPNAQGQNAGATNQSNSKKTEETTNFEISKKVENHIKDTGTLNRVSVAVLVDGTYTTDANGQRVYAPRPDAELKQIEGLVKSAVGFDEKRGDTVQVVNMRFNAASDVAENETFLDWLKRDFQSIVQTLVIGVVAILAILLVVRPLVSRFVTTSDAAAEEEERQMAALSAPSALGALTDQSGGAMEDGEEEMIDIARIEGRVKSTTYRKINDIIERHPEETLTVLRQWMYKEA